MLLTVLIPFGFLSIRNVNSGRKFRTLIQDTHKQLIRDTHKFNLWVSQICHPDLPDLLIHFFFKLYVIICIRRGYGLVFHARLRAILEHYLN